MPRIADYVVVSDGKVSMEIGGDVDKDFTFRLPSNLHAGSRPILACMLDTVNPDNLRFTIRVNNTDVFNGRYNSDVFHTIHEVLPGNLLRAGVNEIEIRVTGGSGELQVGDITIFFQVDI